jgi:hypothetical protein
MTGEGNFLSIDFDVESESRRYFLFFKPRDIIVNENFRIIAHLKNTGNKEFVGGSLHLRNEFGENQPTEKEYKGFEIPKIPPKTKIDVPSPFLLKSPHAGTNYLSIRIFSSNGEEITCFPSEGGFSLDIRQYRFPFYVSNKEEIYEYYGVWFAVALSLIAIGLSIANGILALLQYHE